MAGKVAFAAAIALLAALAHAHPAPPAFRRPREPFAPEGRQQTFYRTEKGHPTPYWTAVGGQDDMDAVDVARAFLVASAPQDVAMPEVKLLTAYTTKHNGIAHVYMRQVIGGMVVTNADANFNIRGRRVLSGYTRFYTGELEVPVEDLIRPKLSAVEAARKLARFLRLPHLTHVTATAADNGLIINAAGLSLDPIPAELNLIQTDNGQDIKLVWHLVVRQDDWWYDAHVDALDGNVLSLVDWVADATYLAFPVGTNDPTDGDRELLVDPHDLVASPIGWHDQGNGDTYTTTIGNNVYAQENWSGSTSSNWINNFRPSGGDNNTYDFPIDYDLEPREYINASITNLFVHNNFLHDVLYQYGFDEVSGNFQETNFGRGGREVDAVQANGQDGAGTNNANFATPPDGQRPRMRMYLYTMTVPSRDGDIAIGTVIHEYAHGLSNRLTGGPDTTSCLGAAQSGGMGEGWGDWISVVFRQRAEYTRDNDWAFGGWQRDMPEGIRTYLYSTKMDVNPTTYEIINTDDYSGVHAKGCVWATALYDGYWNIVDEEGFDADFFYTRGGGNGMALQDVVDGMKLQPCNPNFLQARDAILLADEQNYNGINVCRWWRAFAKRGMGVGATSTGTRVTEDFSLPTECA